MQEPKQVRRITETVYDTESYMKLQQDVDRAGGRILRTMALPQGKGISCEIELNTSKRQF